ncbi:DgyrCDS9505 [Dimorphilus gyrociliatus]|uniref:Innexin n=1 Tax=Dimorphilus gyrociliatus TaxID=2664684 RepID=A0A7I8VYH6_9ANNE|nr:DgyrCDS9505 [Dimorphilus gyrociliatus]
MDKLVRVLLSVREFKVRNDDDFVDKLNRQYSVSLLVTFSLIVSTKQFVGEPIKCWCPAHFTESHRDYANTICWLSNTYYVPFEEGIPTDIGVRTRPKISYYQWVPLVLLIEALMCFIPCLIWRILHKRSGINLSAILDVSRVCERSTYGEVREKSGRYLVSQLHKFFTVQRGKKGCVENISKRCCLVGGKRYAVDPKRLYGLEIIRKLIEGTDWTEIERFPRVTLCDFKIRHLGRLLPYVVQCVLTINLFNEKIFLIIWFWFLILSALTALSLVKWFTLAIYWPGQVDYVRRQLTSIGVDDCSVKSRVRNFVVDYLRRDGLFVLKLLTLGGGEMVCAETLSGLWSNYAPDRRYGRDVTNAKRRRDDCV